MKSSKSNAHAPNAGFAQLEKTPQKSLEGHAETTTAMFTHLADLG